MQAIHQRRNTWFNQIAEDKYAGYIFGIHQVIYDALATLKAEQYCNQISENF